MSEQRGSELAANLSAVTERLDSACRRYGRGIEEVRLLVVTKTYPASDVELLRQLGVRQVAENTDQEARAKLAALEPDLTGSGLRWHMVGQLQRNKAKSVARWADEVQSVDRQRVVDALASAAAEAAEDGHRSRALDVLLQLNIDAAAGESGAGRRGGLRVSGPGARTELAELAERVAGSQWLRLRGVMAVAPQDADPERAFDLLRQTAEWLRREHPDAGEISAGMSGDLEAAVAHGSTCVRVGTAVLGSRRLA